MLKNEAKDKDEAIINLENEIKSLRKSIDLKDRVIAALKNDSDISGISLKGGSQISKKLEESEVLNLSLVKKMEVMKREFFEKKRELKNCQEEVTNLEAELETLKKSKASFMSANEGGGLQLKESDTSLLQRENQALRMDLLKQGPSKPGANIVEVEITSKLHQRLHEAKNEIDRARRRIKLYESEITKLREKLDTSQEQLEKSGEQNDSLKERLRHSSDRNQRIGVQLVEAQAFAQLEHERSASATANEAISRAVSAERAQSYRQMKGLIEQMKYLRTKTERESGYRADLEFMKRFFLMKIRAYQACNRADLAMLEEMGIYPDYSQLGMEEGGKRRGQVSFKAVAQMVLASIKFRKRGSGYRDQLRMRDVVKARLKR